MRHSENSGRLRRWSYLDKFGCQHGLFSDGQVYLLFLTVYLQEGCKREEMEDAMQIVHYGNLSASTVLIQPVDDHDLEEMETELNEIRKQGKADFQLKSGSFALGGVCSLWQRGLRRWCGGVAAISFRSMCGSQKNVLYRWIFAGGIILSLGGISDGYLCRCCSSISVCLVSGISAIYERTRYESKVGVSELGKT